MMTKQTMTQPRYRIIFSWHHRINYNSVPLYATPRLVSYQTTAHCTMSLTTTHPCKYPGCACTAGTFPLAGIDPVTAGPLFANCDCGHVFSQHASVIGAIDLDTNTNPAVISRRSRAPFRTPSPPSTAAATINQGQALPTPPAGSPGRASSTWKPVQSYFIFLRLLLAFCPLHWPLVRSTLCTKALIVS